MPISSLHTIKQTFQEQSLFLDLVWDIITYFTPDFVRLFHTKWKSKCRKQGVKNNSKNFGSKNNIGLYV